MNDEPTPLTDAAIVKDYSFAELVPAKIARQLERELAAMTTHRNQLGELLAKREEELAEAREQCNLIARVAEKSIAQRDRLAEALRNIANEDYRGNRPWSALYAERELAAVEGQPKDIGAEISDALVQSMEAAMEGGKQNVKVSDRPS